MLSRSRCLIVPLTLGSNVQQEVDGFLRVFVTLCQHQRHQSPALLH